MWDMGGVYISFIVRCFLNLMQAVKCRANSYRGALCLRPATSCTRRLLGMAAVSSRFLIRGHAYPHRSLAFAPNWTPNLKRFLLAPPPASAQSVDHGAGLDV